MSHVSPVDSGDPTRAGLVSSTNGEPASRTTSVPPDPATAASRRVWDRLSEQERRKHLESMNPDAVRAITASMPVIEQAKGILMAGYGCDAAAAFALLTRVSSARNVKLRDFAALVVEKASTQDGAGQGRVASPMSRVRHLLENGPGEDHRLDGHGDDNDEQGPRQRDQQSVGRS